MPTELTVQIVGVAEENVGVSPLLADAIDATEKAASPYVFAPPVYENVIVCGCLAR